MKRKKIVALLPIKENSERINSKNFRHFHGRPLFHWVLGSLQKVDIIDCIIINTDARDSLLKNGLIESEKIVLRDRPNHLRGDDVSMNLIIEDDISSIDSDLFLMTHTTNPLITSKTITNAVNTFLNQNEHDCLFTVNKIQTRFYDKNAFPINHDPNNLIKTQDLPIWLEENSCLYIFSKGSFKKTKSRIGSNPIMYPISKTESIDIDDIEDWDIAEAIMTSEFNKKYF